LGILVLAGLLFAYYTGDQATSVATSASFTIDTRDADAVVRAAALTASKDSAAFTIDTLDPDSVTQARSLASGKTSGTFTIDTRDADAVVFVTSFSISKTSGFFTIDTRAASSTLAESASFTIDTRDPDSLTRALSFAASKDSGFFTINTLDPPPEDNETDTLHDLWETIYFGSIFTYGPNDDPDHDGLKNFQEFAFGTDPTVFNGPADVRFSIVANGAGTRLTITHSKHILALAMVTYTYETSTDLKVWTDTTSSWRETADPQNLNGYIEWVTMGYDLPTFPARIFVRVRAKPVPQ
jgi:hypothetical protein